jgi:hypothetical protein
MYFGDSWFMREVIYSLRVWDAAVRHQTLLPPGTILRACRIRRKLTGEEGVEEYSVEFESGGRQYACPLFLFQPRTHAVEQEIVAAAGF